MCYIKIPPTVQSWIKNLVMETKTTWAAIIFTAFVKLAILHEGLRGLTHCYSQWSLKELQVFALSNWTHFPEPEVAHWWILINPNMLINHTQHSQLTKELISVGCRLLTVMCASNAVRPWQIFPVFTRCHFLRPALTAIYFDSWLCIDWLSFESLIFSNSCAQWK